MPDDRYQKALNKIRELEDHIHRQNQGECLRCTEQRGFLGEIADSKSKYAKGARALLSKP